MVILGEDGDDALLQNRTNHFRQRTAMQSHQKEFEGAAAFPCVLPLSVARILPRYSRVCGLVVFMHIAV